MKKNNNNNCVEIFTYRHYNIRLEILKAQRLVYHGVSLWKSELLWSFVRESIASWIHTPPGVNIVIDNRQLGTVNIH